LQNVGLNNSSSPGERGLGGGVKVDARPSNFTPTPALPLQGEGGKDFDFLSDNPETIPYPNIL
jgi:hypothetical protein